MKKNILLVLITSIICISGTVYATYVYRANDISYVPTDENWNVSNVEDAINNLKSNISDINALNNIGDMLYEAGSVNLVANVSDDSFYKDSNDKYILADTETGRNMIDNITYKSLASTEVLKGEVGSDLVNEFSTTKIAIGEFNENSSSGRFYLPGVSLSNMPQYIFFWQTGNSSSTTSMVYDKSRYETKYRRCYNGTYSDITLNVTTNDLIGYDDNGVYLYHKQMATYPYKYLIIY